VQDLTYLYNANGTVQQRHDRLIDPVPEVFSCDVLNRLTERRQRQPSGSERIESFAYDALGNLTQMPSSSAPDVELEYEAFKGRAVKRATEPCAGSICPSRTTYSTGDLYTRTVEADGPASNVEHRYRVYAGGSAIAEIVRNTSGTAVATWYPHTDALGSPNVLINDNGALFRQSFAPFGQSTSEIPVGETGSLIGFTGHDHDSEAGLINMKGRLYDPVIGRFLTADPIVQSPFWSQGLNRYAYVFNSPLNLTDPSGFSAIEDYFQGLNDAPPEQAIPGYIGTGLAVGLAGYAIYEGVSLSVSSGASAASATAASQSGGSDPSGAIGAGIVAMQRFSAALGPTQSTHPGVVPTRSLNAPTGGGRQSATVQNRGALGQGSQPSATEYLASQGIADERTAAVPIKCDGCAADFGPGGVAARGASTATRVFTRVFTRALTWVAQKLGFRTVAPAARGANTAFDIARAGGRHAGTLKNYAGRSAAEIQRGIASYERRASSAEDRQPRAVCGTLGGDGCQRASGPCEQVGSGCSQKSGARRCLARLIGIDVAMSDTHKNYLFDLGFLIKERALEARQRREESPAGSMEREFHSGSVVAFNEVISIMQQQAEGLGIPLSDLRLDDIEPDRDLT
jgi:RHS repeat-associated protein